MLIGITGKSCSGKHTFAKMLQQISRGQILDIDKIAHELYYSGSDLYEKLVSFFGNDIVDERGEINRAKLRIIAFSSHEKLQKLNEIIHPSLKQAIKDIVDNRRGMKPLIIVAAVLRDLELQVDYILQVYCSSKKYLELASKKGVSDSALEQIHQWQTDLPEYDYLVENNGGIDALKSQAEIIWKEIYETKPLDI